MSFGALLRASIDLHATVVLRAAILLVRRCFRFGSIPLPALVLLALFDQRRQFRRHI